MGVDGASTIMKEAEYDRLIKARYQPLAARASPAEPLAAAGPATKLRPRKRCDESTEYQVLSATNFTDWDVAMSPVLSAQAGSVVLTVTEGYSVADRLVTKTGGTIGSLVKAIGWAPDDGDTTWTTTMLQTISFSVPAGQFGVVVSEPLVQRIEGNILSGCADAVESSAFTLDSHYGQTYGDLDWVMGVIRLCNSSSYPVPYCVGDGTHT